MKIAYLITLYKNPEQFKRLFRAIYDRDNVYLIHVDAKSASSVHAEVRESVQNCKNARLMRSYNWVYGGFSAVEIQLDAISQLLEEQFDFFINLSGQDFPLKTQGEIKESLHRVKDKNFITVEDLFEECSVNKRGWLGKYWFEIKAPSWLLPARRRVIPLPINRKIPWKAYMGSTWFIFSHEFCRFLCHDRSVDEYRRFYRHSFIPEESFFQTLIMNSTFRDTVVNDAKRLIIWDPRRIHTFTTSDSKILADSDAFFARKFNPSLDAQIIGQIEERLAARCGLTFDSAL